MMHNGSDDPNLISKIQDPFYLNQIAQTYKDMSNTMDKFEPWSRAWVSEASGAFDSGHKDVSLTFADGFCALLWHKLMGSTILSVTQEVDSNLHVYAHCAKKKATGISLPFINLSKKKTFNVTLSNDENLYTMRHNQESKGVTRSGFEFRGYKKEEEYHLTPHDKNILSDIVLLNGVPLVPIDSLDILRIYPKLADASAPILIAPHSIIYVIVKDFHASGCA
ncbi:hypothetical protein PTKIN_Ptkin02bG0066300 [Pterospermum kingtungense]